MGKVFFGLLFVLLDLSINFDGVSIDIIPDIVGYILLFIGSGELSDRADSFRKLRVAAGILCAVSVFSTVLALTGRAPDNSSLAVILGLVSTACGIYASYAAVEGVRELEARDRLDLGGEKLHSAWLLMILFQILPIVTIVIPVVSLMAIIAGFVFAIVFLVRFHHAYERYGR